MTTHHTEANKMNAQNPDWIVRVNGIPVGSLTSGELKQIRTTVKQDKGLWIAQGVEVIKCAVRVVTEGVKYTPFVLFSWALMGTMQDPDGFNKIVANGPAEYFLTGAYYSFLIACVASMVTGLITRKFYGFKNVFSERKDWLIRVRLNVPTDGLVSCTPKNVGAFYD